MNINFAYKTLNTHRISMNIIMEINVAKQWKYHRVCRSRSTRIQPWKLNQFREERDGLREMEKEKKELT